MANQALNKDEIVNKFNTLVEKYSTDVEAFKRKFDEIIRLQKEIQSLLKIIEENKWIDDAEKLAILKKKTSEFK